MDVGLWQVVMLSSTLLNLPHGPFHAAAEDERIKSVDRAYGTQATMNDPLFEAHLDDIISDDPAIEEHAPDGDCRAYVWSKIRRGDYEFLRPRGAHVRAGRWVSWFLAAPSLVKEWHVRLLIMTVACLKLNLTSASDGRVLQDMRASITKVESKQHGADRDKSMKESKAKAQDLRRRCKTRCI